jgi:hypothetical protein
LIVKGTPETIQCAIQLPDGSNASNVVWALDDTRWGSIGQDGLFRANGLVGGVVKVSATVGSTTVSTNLTIDVAIQDNAGSIPSADLAQLIAGGTADAGFGWLYPYDKTVFPRGLQPPLLQFKGTAASATYLKLTAPHFSYERAEGASSPVRVTIPPEIWKGVTMTAGATDWVTAAVSKLSAGSVTGPIQENWLVAQGKLKGIVYYNSYNSAAAMGTGAILKVKLGQDFQLIPLNGASCMVCHTVSASGSVLSTSLAIGRSAVYDLDTAGNATQRTYGLSATWAFAALTPDGTRAVTNGNGLFGIDSIGYSRLVDTQTYQQIPAPSLTTAVTLAEMPMFSPDGKHLAFVNRDITTSMVLSLMDYDGSQTPPLFSNLRTATQVPSEWIAWPSFLPDSNGVVYHQGTSYYTGGRNGRDQDYAELRLVDTNSGQVNDLKAVNGYLADGSFYLPYGTAPCDTRGDCTGTQDGHVQYEPSALSIAVGGYYWVMFASRRAYGNMIAPGGTVPGGDGPFGPGTPRKKIWVTAVDIDYATKADPSHPAFYLEGQEVPSGNLRPFVALEPCHPEGDSCETGSDCCQGYCRETGRDASNVPILQCVPPPGSSCSNIDEVCVTLADCCDQSLLCLNSRCAIPTPDIR